MGDWIFIVLPGAAMAHIFEEYIYPGGFADALKKLIPRAVHLFTPGFHVAVNGLFLLLCLSSLVIGRTNLVLSLSPFSLIFVNALLHIRGSIVTRGYYPGMITSVFLYIPLAVYVYSRFIMSGQLTWRAGVLSILLGGLYMAVLMGYVLLSQVKRRQ
jgi:hypothetical protein